MELVRLSIRRSRSEYNVALQVHVWRFFSSLKWGIPARENHRKLVTYKLQSTTSGGFFCVEEISTEYEDIEQTNENIDQVSSHPRNDAFPMEYRSCAYHDSKRVSFCRTSSTSYKRKKKKKSPESAVKQRNGYLVFEPDGQQSKVEESRKKKKKKK